MQDYIPNNQEIWFSQEQDFDENGRAISVFGRIRYRDNTKNEIPTSARSYQSKADYEDASVQQAVEEKEIETQTFRAGSPSYEDLQMQTEPVGEANYNPKMPSYPTPQPKLLEICSSRSSISDKTPPPFDPLIKLQIMRGDFILDDDRIPDKCSIISTISNKSPLPMEEDFRPYFPLDYDQKKYSDLAKEIIIKSYKDAEGRLPQEKVAHESKINQVERKTTNDFIASVLNGADKEIGFAEIKARDDEWNTREKRNSDIEKHASSKPFIDKPSEKVPDISALETINLELEKLAQNLNDIQNKPRQNTVAVDQDSEVPRPSRGPFKDDSAVNESIVSNSYSNPRLSTTDHDCDCKDCFTVSVIAGVY